MRGRLWGLLWALCFLWLAVGVQAAEAPVSDDAFASVQVNWNEQKIGPNNILEPSITGLADTAVAQEINEKINAKLPLEQLRLALERAASWGDEDMGDMNITMRGSAFQHQNLLSLYVSVYGLLDEDSTVRHRYYGMNFDLLTGQEITFAELFQNPEAAVAAMEETITTVISEEDMNAYLENAQVLPMPLDNFSLDAFGMTVYYPASQYSNISGTSGAFRFLYYELVPLLAQNNAMAELLEGLILQPEDVAEQVLLDMEAGQLPGLPVQLGKELAPYDETYRILAEPDYTLTERLYQFESPLLDRVWVGTPLYLDEGVAETVTSIRSTHIDLYGVRPGASTLADVTALLGEPDERVAVDENRGYNYLLPEGESYLYDHAGRTLIFHGDGEGMLYCVILEVEGTSDTVL